jgi:hypothetical protein
VTLDTGKRKRKESQSWNLSSPDSEIADCSITTEQSYLVEQKTTHIESNTSLEDLWPLFYSAIGSRVLNCSGLERVGKLCKATGLESERVITAFQHWITLQKRAPCPRADCLLVLVKFNVFRALFSNGTTLGFSTASEYFDDDAISSFAKPMETKTSFPSLSTLPLALRPTKIQCQIPHHPCLDLLPDPQLRDNLIQAGGAYDEDEWCADLIGLSEHSIGRSGLIIWGEPWDPLGWEVSEPFLKHWGWALRGCDELLRATNQWRNRRGESSLSFDVNKVPIVRETYHYRVEVDT